MHLEESPFVVDELSDVVHGPIQQAFVHLGALRVTGPTSMPETAIEFVGHVGLRIVPVDGVVGAGDPMFARVSRVLDVRLVEWMGLIGVIVVSTGHQVVGVAFVFGQGRPTFGLQSVVAPRQPF